MRTFLLTSENLVLQAMQFFIKSSDTQALVTKHAVCVLPHATARTRLPSMSTSHGSGLKNIQVFLNALESRVETATSANSKPRKERTLSAGDIG